MIFKAKLYDDCNFFTKVLKQMVSWGYYVMYYDMQCVKRARCHVETQKIENKSEFFAVIEINDLTQEENIIIRTILELE